MMFNFVYKRVIMENRIPFFVFECFFETRFELEMFEMSHNHTTVVFTVVFDCIRTSKMKHMIYM